MSRKVNVVPGKISRAAAGMGAVIAGLFLVFGVIFFVVALEDTPSSEGGLQLLQAAFFVIWVVVCLGIAIVNLRIFIKAKNPADDSILQLEEEAGEAPAVADFDVRLRKLETLRQDGLITEDEYQAKRAQLLEEKW